MLALSFPAVYTLELTAACDQACPACAASQAGGRPQAPLPASVWEAWLAIFGPQAVRIRLSGGEPTLHPQFEQILEAACSYEARVSVFTHGRWRKPEALLALFQRQERLAGLLISLHGARPETHAAFTGDPSGFDQVLSSVRRAVQAGIHVALSVVLTRQNCGEVDQLALLRRQLGVEHIAFNRLIGPPDARLDPSPRQLRQAVRRIQAWQALGEPLRFADEIPQCFAPNSSSACLAGAVSVAIGPRGQVRPCLFSPTVVGSLLEWDLQALWLGEKMNAWRALPVPACGACAAFSTCHGACRAQVELHPERRDPLLTHPLQDFTPSPQPEIELPAAACPAPAFRLRPEPFGYAALGRGQAVPLSPLALPVLQACDGTATFAELAERFGEGGLQLLGELWQEGLLDAT